jgi:chemotaxis protein MotB
MSAKTIILVKKAKRHHGHHSGAWKVAYADFVTAMMSLFIILWLMNSSDHVRRAVAGYFNDPLGRSTLTGTDRSGSADNLPITRDNIQQLKERLEQSIHKLNDLKSLSNQIEITVTPEGLRIELLETKDGSFFKTGSADLNANGRELLTVLAQQLGTVPNRISIEGHTDARPYAGAANYGNWELSSDRANAARRLMQRSGLRVTQVSQVRGYADQRLRVPGNPLDPSNRRISLIVQYLDAPPAPESIPAAQQIAETASPPASTRAVVANPLAAKKPVAAVVSGSFVSRLLGKLRGH